MTGKSKTGIFYGWVIVATGCTILALQWGSLYTYGVFFTELCRDLGWTRGMVSGAYSVLFLWHGFIYFVAGKIYDRHGPQLPLGISFVILSIGYALMSIVEAPWQLYIFYGIILGTGLGFGYLSVVSTVSRWFVKRRGIALGITASGGGIGTLALAPFAQFLITKFDWRNSYLILAGLLAAIGLPISRLMRLETSQKELSPYSREEIEIQNRHDGLPSTTAFTPKQAAKTKAFWLLFALYASLDFSIQMVMIHLDAYAKDVGLAPMLAATVLGVVGGGSIPGKIAVGSISDKIGRKASFFTCLLLMAVMMLWLMEARQPWQFYLFSALFGFSYGGCIPLFPAASADWFGTKFHGTIFGLISISCGIGGSSGPFLAGYIHDVTGSYELAIIIAAAVLFIAMGLSLAIKTPQAQKSP